MSIRFGREWQCSSHWTVIAGTQHSSSSPPSGLRDFIDPKHLLIQIDEQFDFSGLVEPLEDYYCRDNGGPAIRPEVLVRALLISSLYDVSSFSRLCAAISTTMDCSLLGQQKKSQGYDGQSLYQIVSTLHQI